MTSLGSVAQLDKGIGEFGTGGFLDYCCFLQLITTDDPLFHEDIGIFSATTFAHGNRFASRTLEQTIPIMSVPAKGWGLQGISIGRGARSEESEDRMKTNCCKQTRRRHRLAHQATFPLSGSTLVAVGQSLAMDFRNFL